MRRALLGKQPKAFRPQSKFLSLISTGSKYAIASRGGWSVKNWTSGPKDWIDRRFMDKFNDLPDMDEKDTRLPSGLASADVVKKSPPLPCAAVVRRKGGPPCRAR